MLDLTSQAVCSLPRILWFLRAPAGFHHAASTPALDDLIALGPATPQGPSSSSFGVGLRISRICGARSRAKSAPAVATPDAGAGQNLLAFADFSSMPQQAQPMPATSTAGFSAPAAPLAAPGFADFGSAPTFDAFAPAPAHGKAAAPAAPRPASGPSADLLDLL
ncbi:icd [Symbiodinium sp. CCMP2456]|nr:icd [Symbiodinium sp. CCMP2456]